MDDYDDFGSYNGDVEHDMWVDYDHYRNTGEPDVFDEEDIDALADELGAAGAVGEWKRRALLRPPCASRWAWTNDPLINSQVL